MRAVLLAAGLGTRLQPITNTIPKCLVEIEGQALLGIWLDLLLGSGFERVLINTHHLAQSIKDYIALSPWREQLDLVYEPELLQTGGTLLHNEAWFKNESFLVAHADNLTVFNVPEFVGKHCLRPSGVEITMMTFDTDVPQSCGIVEEHEGRIVAFHEKVPNPPGNRANAAVYIVEPSIFSLLKAVQKPVIDLSTEILPRLLGRMQSYHNTIYHRDIGTVESLTVARNEYPSKKSSFFKI